MGLLWSCIAPMRTVRNSESQVTSLGSHLVMTFSFKRGLNLSESFDQPSSSLPVFVTLHMVNVSSLSESRTSGVSGSKITPVVHGWMVDLKQILFFIQGWRLEAAALQIESICIWKQCTNQECIKIFDVCVTFLSAKQAKTSKIYFLPFLKTSPCNTPNIQECLFSQIAYFFAGGPLFEQRSEKQSWCVF